VKSRSDSSSRSSEGHRAVTVDVGYGGAFYAIINDSQLGLNVSTSPTAEIVQFADAVTGQSYFSIFLHKSYTISISYRLL